MASLQATKPNLPMSSYDAQERSSPSLVWNTWSIIHFLDSVDLYSWNLFQVTEKEQG